MSRARGEPTSVDRVVAIVQRADGSMRASDVVEAYGSLSRGAVYHYLARAVAAGRLRRTTLGTYEIRSGPTRSAPLGPCSGCPRDRDLPTSTYCSDCRRVRSRAQVERRAAERRGARHGRIDAKPLLRCATCWALVFAGREREHGEICVAADLRKVVG